MISIPYSMVQFALVRNAEFRLEDGLWVEHHVERRVVINLGEAVIEVRPSYTERIEAAVKAAEAERVKRLADIEARLAAKYA